MKEKSIKIRRISEQEVYVGKNRLFLDGNIINFINVGDIDENTANIIDDISRKLVENVIGKFHMLVDLNKGGKISPKARGIFQKSANDENAGKTALFGLHLVARVLALFFINITNKKDIRFFKTQQEALKWLKEGSNE